jgi:hypothetical protein
VGLISYSLLVPGPAALDALTARLEAAGIPVRKEDDGRVRANDADGNFIEIVVA